ncbi:thiosulfate oxidation carrier complex protein SoxZ [Roseivivax sediminis]|uniref:Sulfur compound chelating protein SoxZ n=1 Tax=Roseivivax sediminis TaxID=936889 RepID=A0A1I2D319_9RHOB|nr:thiosulfate oxidation carrier complex protein SoxZ [Roseivivax sediminis]SFE74453.1 sulfur compound chelating protein SoxZ [Roseivivax sediminis]
MAENVTPRVRVPATATAGEVVTIKTLISHRMESGERRDEAGRRVPRSIIHRFVARFNGETVIDVAMEPAISTNPFFEFDARVPESGTMTFAWYDDDGSIYEEAREIVVE